jgi:hypothetical protein
MLRVFVFGETSPRGDLNPDSRRGEIAVFGEERLRDFVTALGDFFAELGDFTTGVTAPGDFGLSVVTDLVFSAIDGELGIGFVLSVVVIDFICFTGVLEFVIDFVFTVDGDVEVAEFSLTDNVFPIFRGDDDVL